MTSRNIARSQGRKGAAYVLALLMLIVLSTLAVALATTTDLEMMKANNAGLALGARLAAESGMDFMRYHLARTALPAWAPGNQMLGFLATELNTALGGTANLAGVSVTYDGSVTTVPPIQLAGGRSFSARVEMSSGNVLKVTVTGTAPAGSGDPGSTVDQTLTMEYQPETPSAYSYGIFSKGPLAIGANLSFTGVNSPGEASMCSAASGSAIIIDSGYVDGDLCATHADATMDIGATVNGKIRKNVPEVTVERPDGAEFLPYATNLLNSSSNFGLDHYENIRIAAGTNPEFGNSVTISGVMYVETPNTVTFANSVEMTGAIVTEDAGEGADLTANNIYFKNNLLVHGIEELPDEPQFEGLQEHAGTAILAPGFDVGFKNNFTTVNGSVIAESLELKNNLDGIVYGSIIILGGSGLNFNQNARLAIDRSKYHGDPPGTAESQPTVLIPLPDSYQEGAS
jgi:hypothetical protein